MPLPSDTLIVPSSVRVCYRLQIGEPLQLHGDGEDCGDVVSEQDEVAEACGNRGAPSTLRQYDCLELVKELDTYFLALIMLLISVPGLFIAGDGQDVVTLVYFSGKMGAFTWNVSSTTRLLAHHAFRFSRLGFALSALFGPDLTSSTVHCFSRMRTYVASHPWPRRFLCDAKIILRRGSSLLESSNIPLLTTYRHMPLTLTGNYKRIAQWYFPDADRFLSVLGSVASLFNGAGRIIFGLALDR